MCRELPSVLTSIFKDDVKPSGSDPCSIFGPSKRTKTGSVPIQVNH